MVDPSHASPSANHFLSGKMASQVMLHWPDSFPSNCIGPATIIWNNNQPWVIIHIALVQEFKQALLTCAPELVLERKQMGKIEMYGPKCNTVLHRVLNLATNQDMTANVWHNLSKFESPCSIPLHVVLGLEIHDPRLQFPTSKNHILPIACPEIDICTSWPDNVNKSSIWTHAGGPKATECELNKRRQQVLELI